MAKRDDRIITSVYLTKEMCSQIDKMADRGHISRNEQIRRYIEKGLAVEGYSQDIDLIAGIIRQEVQAVYHIEDIKAVVEQQANRIAKMHMKSGKVDTAAFFSAGEGADERLSYNKHNLRKARKQAAFTGYAYFYFFKFRRKGGTNEVKRNDGIQSKGKR